MQIQIFNERTKEMIAWLYIDCDEDKLIDSVMSAGYGIKSGKSLKAREVKENNAGNKNTD